MKLDFSEKNIEDLRDCIIVFDLLRLSNSGVKSKAVDTYYVNNTIEQFDEKKFQSVAVDKVRYFEKVIKSRLVADQSTSNTFDLTLRSSRIFQCIDPGCKPGESKDPFSKARIEAGLRSRINERNPDQAGTWFCGPAAYFFCLLNSRPDIYKRVVKELWEAGTTKIGNLEITPKLNNARKVSNFFDKSGAPKIAPIDWITLASLKDSQNNFLSIKLYKHPTVDQILGGSASITSPEDMKQSLKSSGFKIVNEYKSLIEINYDIINALNNYAGSNNYIVVLTTSNIIRGSVSPNLPNHWIVWTDKLRKNDNSLVDKNTSYQEKNLKLKFFSWGVNQDQLKKNIDVLYMCKTIYHAFVVSRNL